MEKRDSTYYYNDIFPILEEIPANENDKNLITNFKNFIEERNIVYISKSKIDEYLSELSYFSLLKKASSGKVFLREFIEFCKNLKFY